MIGSARRQQLTAFGLVVSLGLFLSVAIAPYGNAEVRDSSLDVSVDSMDTDTVILAKELGIGIDELKWQIALQDVMDTIPFAALDPGYAEDGSQLGSNFEIWYRSAEEPNSKLKAAMSKAGVLGDVRFVKVPLSVQDLLREAKSLDSALQENRVPVGVTIDTASGGVVLHPYVGYDHAAEETAVGLAEQGGLPFVWGDPPPEAANYGGRDMSLPLGGCTGGFVVVDNGSRRVSTAGHCGQVGDSVTYGGGTGFTVKRRDFDNFHDWAFVDKPGVTWTNKVQYSSSGSTRDVTGNRSWAAMDIGDPVSKYGDRTDYTQGVIVDRHACSPAGCDPEALFIRVDPLSAYPKMCDHGDSGGPFMYNFTAYGIVSGVFPNGDCTYMPVQLMGNAATS